MLSISELVSEYARTFDVSVGEGEQFKVADDLIRALLENPDKESMYATKCHGGVSVYLNGPYVHVLFREINKNGAMCFVYKEYETVNDLENAYIKSRNLSCDEHYYTNRKQLFRRLGNLSS